MSGRLDQDVQLAEQFWLSCDVEQVRARYEHEVDLELQEDWVKLGCYLAYREQGVAPRWAAMSACRRAARMGGSDQRFNAIERRKMENMNPRLRDRIQALAQGAGIQTQGKFYLGGLGRYTDPQAWVSTVDEARATVVRKGLPCEGLVNYQPPERPLPEPPAMAEDIRDRLVEKKLQEDPALRERVRKRPGKLRELQEAVVARHGRQPKRSGYKGR